MNQPNPPEQNPYQASNVPNAPPIQPNMPGQNTDSTGGVIPYKNPPALIAYYLGIFSLLPCIGILLAIPAIVASASSACESERPTQK